MKIIPTLFSNLESQDRSEIISFIIFQHMTEEIDAALLHNCTITPTHAIHALLHPACVGGILRAIYFKVCYYGIPVRI